MKTLLIFDLDGTLADTREDIANAVNLTRAHYRLAPLSLERVVSYVGNGSRTLIERSFSDQPDTDAATALCVFSDMYARHLIGKSRLYPGVEATLYRLHAEGVPMAVLSNKPGDLCRRIISHFQLESYFFKVIGGGDLPALKPDPGGIFHILDQCESPVAPESVWMVGDHWTDLETASRAKIKSAFCRYGFGDRKGLECNEQIDRFQNLETIIR